MSAQPTFDDPVKVTTATRSSSCHRATTSAGVPVTLREYLTLMEAMDADLASRRVEDFYYLARATLVKDERNLDKFDRVFGHVFKGLELLDDCGHREVGPPAVEALHLELRAVAAGIGAGEVDPDRGQPVVDRDLVDLTGRSERARVVDQ